MWKCPVCETNNDDQKKICPVCGRGQNTAVILEPEKTASNTGALRHSSTSDESAARPYEPRHYTSPDDAYASRPSGNAHEEVVHADSADLWKKRRHNNTIIIAIIAILAVAAAGIAGWYFARPKTPLELHVNVENADKIDGVWYIENSADVTWGSNRSKTTYNVSLLGENGDILRYYENTTINEMNITHDIIVDGNNYTLHIVAAEGKDTADNEIVLAAIPAPEEDATYADPVLEFETYETVGDSDVLETSSEPSHTLKSLYKNGKSVSKFSDRYDITLLQTRLAELGWLESSGITGSYDDATENAVKDFQQYANSLLDNESLKTTPDGKAGNKTLLLLCAKDAPSRPTATPSAISDDTVIEFEDENLANAIRKELSITGDITYGDLQNLTYLNAPSRNITCIDGLEYCENLTKLHLSYNLLTDISPLAALSDLTDLRLSQNQITDISPLASLSDLTKLYISENQITDISPLASLSDLTVLQLSYNHITDISPLDSLFNLSLLDLERNQITDISPLAGLSSLEKLYIDEDNVVNLSSISHLDCLIIDYINEY